MNKIVSYKCPNCGGPLKYNPQKQKYACEFCLSEFVQKQVDEIKPEETQAEPAEAAEAGPEQVSEAGTGTDEASGQSDRRLDQESNSAANGGAVLYTCPSCGAQVVTDDTTAATFCYYCHNPVILTGKLSGEYLPDYVVPFSIDKDKAVNIFNGWMKKKRYVPKSFYTPDQIEKLSGVYFPYLMYSCRVDGELHARGDRLRIWVSGNYRYTETQIYDVRRNGNMNVTHVPRSALKKANRQLIEGVFPFQMEKMLPFSMGYLSGFLAERRDMDKEEAAPEVKEEVRQFAEHSLRSSIGTYDSVRVEDHSETLRDERWEYALLPVWTLTYRDPGKDKMYYFTINGQTGKVCGVLPVDKGKLAVLFASIFFPVMILMLILGYMI